ncbi:MFS transporter, partial [Deinococcus pimensis]|uniref:MFS transporter n=1 Tax=Deinococcus pimensis TaxID=309888 RepID=UPI00146FC7E5
MTTVPTSTLPARTIVAGFLAFALMGAAQAMYGPSIPRLGEFYGENLARTGLILSAHALGALVGVLGSVPLERTALARWRAVLSVALIALGGLTLGLGPTLGLALVGAVVVGLGYGGLTIGLNGLFSRAFGERSGAMLNLLNAMFGIGSVLGPLVVSLAVRLDPRAPFVVLAVACALAAPLALSVDDRLPPAPPERTATSKPLLLAFVALLVLGVGVEASSAGWAATYLVTLGASAGSAATFTAVYFTAFTLGRFLAAPLSLRVPPARFVGGTLALALVALLL